MRSAVPSARSSLVPSTRLLVLGVLGVAAVYLAWHLDRGWVPLDEGSLAHPAQRVLLGELPHRDFDDVYTGGLAWLNAGAFRLFGARLWSMRLVLFLVFLAWVPAVQYVASRFTRPLVAAGITLVAVVWSVPNYAAAMPSWYNLFLATFGVAAVLRHLDAGRRRWLVAAGVAGGLSVLVKVLGLYYVAGVLLFLVHHAQARSRAAWRAGAGIDADVRDAAARAPASPAYASFVTLGLVAFAGLVLAVLRERALGAEGVLLALPGVVVAAMLVRDEWTLPAGPGAARLRELMRLVAPFLAGVAAPVALFALPYLRAGALGALAYGVLVLPASRLRFAALHLPWSSLPPLLVTGTVVGLAVWSARRGHSAAIGRRGLLVLGLLLAAVLAASGPVPSVYRIVLFALRGILPVLALTTAWLFARDRDVGEEAATRRAGLVLLLAVASVSSLVQFPFAVAIYFCYVAPLVVLTVAAFASYVHRPVAPAVQGMAILFAALFAVLRLNDSPLNDMDRGSEPYPETRRVALDRAGLSVPLWQAEQYEATVAVVRRHARGAYIWVSPDAPQLYFLTGYRNPTRSLFEFFDDTTGRAARILDALEQHDVSLVVLNTAPQFSPRISLPLYRELARRYPHSAFVEPYLVKWRDAAPGATPARTAAAPTALRIPSPAAR